MNKKKGLKLSLTVITLNEEKNIKRCLESVKEVADEIVVVDSGSNDKTVKIAESYGAEVLFRKFDNYAAQKNFAADKAGGEWILSLDGDETITYQLGKEIIQSINNPKHDYCAYSIPRKNIILGKFIKHSRWQPELDRHIWLWKKEKGKWVGDVHEELMVEGKVGRLENYKIHHIYETVAEFFDMMDRYSNLEVFKLSRNGVSYSHFKLITQPVYNFLVRYFYRLGFLDGWRGFVLSYLMAIYHFELWTKMWVKATNT